jgi:hypothetical protein
MDDLDREVAAWPRFSTGAIWAGGGDPGDGGPAEHESQHYRLRHAVDEPRLIPRPGAVSGSPRTSAAGPRRLRARRHGLQEALDHFGQYSADVQPARRSQESPYPRVRPTSRRPPTCEAVTEAPRRAEAEVVTAARRLREAWRARGPTGARGDGRAGERLEEARRLGQAGEREGESTGRAGPRPGRVGPSRPRWAGRPRWAASRPAGYRPAVDELAADPAPESSRRPRKAAAGKGGATSMAFATYGFAPPGSGAVRATPAAIDPGRAPGGLAAYPAASRCRGTRAPAIAPRRTRRRRRAEIPCRWVSSRRVVTRSWRAAPSSRRSRSGPVPARPP